MNHRTSKLPYTLYMDILPSMLAWVAPRRCLLCGNLGQPPFPWDAPLCQSCAASLKPIHGIRCKSCGKELRSEIEFCYSCRESGKTGFEIFPIFLFRDQAAQLVRAYKHGGHPSLGGYWKFLVAKEISTRWPDRTLVPVPPRPEKIRAGIWDQVEEIAWRLEADGLPVARVLCRNRDDQQKRLSKAARAGNAQAAYSLDSRKQAEVPEKAVILDDVCTTGATIATCASVLLNAGAKEVSAIVLAAD
ncbi:MAG: phosphoribosyltransferase [Spirochaetes bacterium]|nr:MAG: phosphoribosyltransferase [Spirochaetota bacterium]